MGWLGWLVALLAAAGAAWLLRAYRAERARAAELLYEKMDLENELDSLHAERVANPPPPAAAVVAPVIAASHAAEDAAGPLRELAGQIDEFRSRSRAYDAAVEQCLQPLELMVGADAQTLASALGFIDKARKPLFAARMALLKTPLQKDNTALAAVHDALQDDAAPPAPAGDAEADTNAAQQVAQSA